MTNTLLAIASICVIVECLRGWYREWRLIRAQKVLIDLLRESALKSAFVDPYGDAPDEKSEELN